MALGNTIEKVSVGLFWAENGMRMVFFAFYFITAEEVWPCIFLVISRSCLISRSSLAISHALQG